MFLLQHFYPLLVDLFFRMAWTDKLAMPSHNSLFTTETKMGPVLTVRQVTLCPLGENKRKQEKHNLLIPVDETSGIASTFPRLKCSHHCQCHHLFYLK